MTYRFQYRGYRLPFRVPVRTAHGPWAQREGLIVRLEDDRGRVGFGEAAPVPGFGTETSEEAEAAVRTLGDRTDEGAIADLPERLRCVHHALRTALDEIARTGGIEDDTPAIATPAAVAYLGVAALLPAGRAVLANIAPRIESGFRVFKWKVGVGDVADELALLDDVCAALPSGAKLRLDANGAWDRRKAERWLERCAERPIEFVEQPIASDLRGAKDLLLGLAGDYPTTLALDESLVGDRDVEEWIGAGWPGVFVLKPSLIADISGVLETLRKANAAVVFSSALETAVGARASLRTAFSWAAGANPAGATTRALGFGVWPLFADSRFDGPAGAPFIRREDVEAINVEAVWNALS